MPGHSEQQVAGQDETGPWSLRVNANSRGPSRHPQPLQELDSVGRPDDFIPSPVGAQQTPPDTGTFSLVSGTGAEELLS